MLRKLTIEDIAYPEPGETESAARRYDAEGAALTFDLTDLAYGNRFYILITAQRRVFDYLDWVTRSLVQVAYTAEIEQEFNRAVARQWEITKELKAIFRGIFHGPDEDDPFVRTEEFQDLLRDTWTLRR